MSGGGGEVLWNVWEWLGGPPGCPGVVGRPFRMSRRVGRPSRMSVSGQETLTDARVWLGGLPGCSGVFGMPSWMTGSCRVSIPKDRRASPEVWE